MCVVVPEEDVPTDAKVPDPSNPDAADHDDRLACFTTNLVNSLKAEPWFLVAKHLVETSLGADEDPGDGQNQ